MDVEQRLDIQQDALIDKIVVSIGTVAFALMIVLTIAQVLVRTADIQISGIHQTESVSRVLLIVGTYFGAAVASRNGEHIVFPTILEAVGRRSVVAHRVLKIVNSVLSAAFIIVCVWAVLRTVVDSWSAELFGLPMSSGVLYSCILVGLLCMIVYEFLNLRHQLRGYSNENE
jgi:TRAP-type C4-dicarboxylate transport system permease small subunit